MAIPPMPISLAYLNISSGDADDAATPAATSISGKIKAMAGTITHHTAAEPRQMMNEYLNPTI